MLKNNLPNIITLLNLTCGIVSIIFSFEGLFFYSSLCVYLALIFDFFDGFIAKKFQAISQFGKNLDTLADLISFGLAPFFLLFSVFTNTELFLIICYLPFIATFASAIRLARFNTSPQNISYFKGLPTPINAFFWVGWISISMKYDVFLKGYYETFFITILCLFSFLLVSNIKFFKISFLINDKFNRILSILFFSGCLVLILLFKKTSPFYISIFYIIISIIYDNEA